MHQEFAPYKTFVFFVVKNALPGRFKKFKGFES
jgi:hypothetical protein